MSASKTKIGKAKAVFTANGAETEVLTLAEAAAYLRVEATEIDRLADTGVLPGQKIGGQWRFYKPALQHWLGTPKKIGLLSQVGALKNDPHLDDMLKEIYQRRTES
jgi:excisionase family DNA binding protein